MPAGITNFPLSSLPCFSIRIEAIEILSAGLLVPATID